MDAFLLFHGMDGIVFTWTGEFAPPALQKAARALAKRLHDAKPHISVVHAREGEETQGFWEAMGSSHEDKAAR